MSKVKWNLVGLLGVLGLAGVGCEKHSAGGGGTAETWFAEGIDGFEKIGGSAEYVVEDGVLIGTTVEGSPNTFLCSGPHADFELEFEVLCDVDLNSGVQIRSHVYEEDTEGLIGFQVHSVKAGSGPYKVQWRNVKFTEL